MENGDEIYIYVLDRTLKYTVTGTDVVEPDDSSKLEVVQGKDLLTLVTCTPYGVNSHRLLVHAERAPFEAATSDSGDGISGNKNGAEKPSAPNHHRRTCRYSRCDCENLFLAQKTAEVSASYGGNKMTEWDRLHRRAQMIKDRYPAGTRIMLLHMGSDPRPIEPNSKGTVVAVDDIGTVHCDFDNGRSLGMIPGEDTFRTLTAEEIAEEQCVDESEAPTMKL